MAVFQRLNDSIAWRRRRAEQRRFLTETFSNAGELIRSYEARSICETAIARDGTVIRHPRNRLGLAGMILEVWFEQVYSGRFYEPRPGDVIIDAGANIGLFSLLLGRSCHQCRVLAFEPFEENFRLLQENVVSAGLENVELFQLGLAATSGNGLMLDGGGRSQDHRLVQIETDASTDSQRISTISFADVLAFARTDRITLFKCDIEGSERELFASATRTDIDRVDRYAIEYHDNIRSGTRQFLVELFATGYDVVQKPATDGDYGMFYAVHRRVHK